MSARHLRPLPSVFQYREKMCFIILMKLWDINDHFVTTVTEEINILLKSLITGHGMMNGAILSDEIIFELLC